MIWQENEVIEFYDSTQSQAVGGCEPCSHHKTKTDKAIIIWRVPLSIFCKSWQLHMFSKTRQKSKTQPENKELHRPMAMDDCNDFSCRRDKLPELKYEMMKK